MRTAIEQLRISLTETIAAQGGTVVIPPALRAANGAELIRLLQVVRTAAWEGNRAGLQMIISEQHIQLVQVQGESPVEVPAPM